MRRIYICDNSICYAESQYKISFRLKIEIARLLDKLGVDVIETSAIMDDQTDYLVVKSISSTIKNSCLTVPVNILDKGNIQLTWDAVKTATHPRLQVPVPCSTVQMEYFCHKKPEAMLELVSESVSACKALCPEVEFTAMDFTRSDASFLKMAIGKAIQAGATTVTLADLAGDLLPDELGKAVSAVREMVPEGIRLGVKCSNALFLADACAVEALRAGADEFKTSVFGVFSAHTCRFSSIVNARADALGISCGINATQLEHVSQHIRDLCASQAQNRAGSGAIEQMQQGDSDAELPIPQTYRLDSYLINSGNVISATCHLRLAKGDEKMENVCVGNGPVDASFRALDNLIGVRCELDDFKIQSVTEGCEAMGKTMVLLRHNGKLYSGKGVSTDIVGSSILAYLDAVNKIAYEEDRD